MKRICSSLAIIIFFMLPIGYAQADKEQAVFAIQKAKSFLDKVKSKSEEMKTPADTLRHAKEFLEQAEAILKRNTSMLGKLKQEAEPDILYFAEMSEISASIALSRLEKSNQEKEKARLEKLIPDIESKIRIIADKDTEIQRLTEELKKPRGTLQTLTSEINQLKKEKSVLSSQVSQLTLERENQNGKLEALGGVLAAAQKNLSEKNKAVEDLAAENRRLRDEMKARETQKGSDIVDMRSQLQAANHTAEFFNALSKFDFLVRLSEKGGTFIIPRKNMLKMTPKGPVLTEGGEAYTARFADLAKRFPESRFKINSHGFGNPAKNEDKKATEAMAQLLKQALVKNGAKEGSVEITGSGSGSPLFSKGAADENRRIEITVDH